MAASRYRRFLKLCEEWPVDETKRGRDLGAYLRQRVAQAFREGENTQVTGLWGPPAAGRRLGRWEERTRQGRGQRAACRGVHACARLPTPVARARGPSCTPGNCRERRPSLLFSALIWLHFGVTEESFLKI